MTVHAVSVRHNFETAHRLPHLGGKCSNLHGHSWWVTVTVSADTLASDGTVVEFGAFKGGLRGWIDQHLDHGAMLGYADPLRAALEGEKSKLVAFGAPADMADEPASLATDLEWPTVENVARLLARVGTNVLTSLPAPASAEVTRVSVEETAVNTAEWSR